MDVCPLTRVCLFFAYSDWWNLFVCCTRYGLPGSTDVGISALSSLRWAGGCAAGITSITLYTFMYVPPVVHQVVHQRPVCEAEDPGSNPGSVGIFRSIVTVYISTAESAKV